MRLLTRVEQLAKVTYESRQVKCVRYNVGTIGGEISGERTCKRRSAKHLEFLPSLLEGRCSVQLSYGRAANPDSKAFTVRMNTVLDGLTICRKGRRSIQVSFAPILGYSFDSTKVAKPIRQPILPKSWSNWNGRNGETDVH